MQTAVRQIAQMTHSLSLFEKAEFVKMIMADIQLFRESTFPQGKALHSAYGICAGCSPEPSEEDIAVMRREVFRRTNDEV